MAHKLKITQFNTIQKVRKLTSTKRPIIIFTLTTFYLCLPRTTFYDLILPPSLKSGVNKMQRASIQSTCTRVTTGASTKF